MLDQMLFIQICICNYYIHLLWGLPHLVLHNTKSEKLNRYDYIQTITPWELFTMQTKTYNQLNEFQPNEYEPKI